MKVIFDSKALRSQVRREKPSVLRVSNDYRMVPDFEVDALGTCQQHQRLLCGKAEMVFVVPLKMTQVTRYDLLQLLCGLSPFFKSITHPFDSEFEEDLQAMIARRPEGMNLGFWP